jgi:V/A-type H+-transporting ATPase subunit D
MAVSEQIPPGRAGRLWLLDRIAAARRGADILDKKRQLLLREQQHLAGMREAAFGVWQDSCREAEEWGLRAGVLGGRAGVDLVASGTAARATADVVWHNTMGVVHPETCDVQTPGLSPEELAGSNSAMAPAAGAYSRALVAGAAYGVVDRAWRAISAEVLVTRRRLRAIERHRLPELEAALASLELRLEETEREERMVTRWAAQHRHGSSA